MSIIIFLIILLILVIVHEFGHFYSAKKFGIRVDEFGFGFPPKIFGYKRGETEYTFNLLPIGGFVKIFGENPTDENTSGPDSHRSFVNKPKWQQAIVLFGGVFANFILAWLLFSVGFMSGFPTSVGSGIGNGELSDISLMVVSVAPNSPAENSGIMPGDRILSLRSGKDQITDISVESVRSFVTSHKGKVIELGYSRGNQKNINIAELTPVSEEGGDAKIGIGMDQIGIAKLSFFSALKEGMATAIYSTKETAVGLYRLIADSLRGQGSLEGVSGPVGLVGIIGDAYTFGFSYLLSFTAIISINLAVINLIPFPALDGGRLFFLLIEKIRGRKVNAKLFNYANIAGFSLLILFMIIITYHDITKLF